MTLSSRFPSATALLTDLYQLTMAQGYLRAGIADRRACFHLFYRRAPFGGGYAVAAGLEDALSFLTDLRFSPEDIVYLRGLRTRRGGRLFDDALLSDLSERRFHLDVDAVPEGTVTFPHAPLLRVVGSLLECQIVETALLNVINFSTLIATKAARIKRAAGGDPVLEFGLRRAQGIDGGLTATRATYVGGCDATSNVLAGRMFGIPVRGTHAHSWVMAFGDETAAFRAFADAMPDNCVFLVDTYDTLDGVARAVEVGLELRDEGHEIVGIRLDSGDLGALAKEARRLLDRAGLTEAKIVASNDLDEDAVRRLREEGAPIDVWGIGTRLTTAFDQPALGGVYKLAAIADRDGDWTPRLKVSDLAIKTSVPGVLSVRRYAGLDVVYDAERHGEPEGVAYEVVDGTTHEIPEGGEDLLVPVLRDGAPVREPPALADVRARALSQIESLPEVVARLDRPAHYPVALSDPLHRERRRLIAAADRGEVPVLDYDVPEEEPR